MSLNRIQEVASELNSLVETELTDIQTQAKALTKQIAALNAVPTDVISVIQRQKLKECAELMTKVESAMTVATEAYRLNSPRLAPPLVAVAA